MIQCDLLKEVIFAEGTGGGRDSNFCQEFLELLHTQRKSHDSNNQCTLNDTPRTNTIDTSYKKALCGGSHSHNAQFSAKLKLFKFEIASWLISLAKPASVKWLLS